jgi:hypothetical protein
VGFYTGPSPNREQREHVERCEHCKVRAFGGAFPAMCAEFYRLGRRSGSKRRRPYYGKA